MTSSRFINSTLAAVATFAVAACSSDTPAEPTGASADAITFEAEVAALPRTTSGDPDRTSGVTTTENIPEFRIWAYDPYAYRYVMEGVVVTRTGLNSWTYTPTVDWPGNPVNFTAVSPASAPFTANPHWFDMIRYTNPGTEDLLVARVNGVSQTSGRLRLHFYHALAMVKVMLRNSLTTGKVRVKSVTVINVANYGQFYFPNEGISQTDPYGQLSQYWEVYGGASRLPVFLSDEGTTLPVGTFAADNQGFNFFIPSKLYPFDFDTYYNSSYLEIDYRIEDAEGHTIWPDASTDYRLISALNPGYGQLRLGLGEKIPDQRWLPGKIYRYSVDISDPATVPPGAASEPAQSSPGLMQATTKGVASSVGTLPDAPGVELSVDISDY